MLHLVEVLRRSPAIQQVQVLDFVDETSVKYLKCRAEFVDGSMLQIEESLVAGKNKYSYHWQDAQHQLLVRWDNAPHHSRFATFPHHRHESGGVHESPRVSIEEVLAEIERRVKTFWHK